MNKFLGNLGDGARRGREIIKDRGEEDILLGICDLVICSKYLESLHRLVFVVSGCFGLRRVKIEPD